MSYGFVAHGMCNEPTRLSEEYNSLERARLAAQALWAETDCYSKITIVEVLEVIK